MYLRKLPSGSWQCTVRDPSGRRHSATFKLKSQARVWGAEQEARYARGDRRDPRAGEIRIGEWRERCRRASVAESPTQAKADSLWRTHCQEQWADWPMNAVTRMEAQEWVNRLRTTRRARSHGRDVADDPEAPTLSPATIAEIVHVMSSLYAAAMEEDPPLVASNPFARLDLPRVDPPPIQFYERHEAEALYRAVEELFGLQWRTLVELGMSVGLRPGESYGLHVDRVDWARGQIHVREVMTRYGIRPYPKSRRSHRVVPVPPRVLEAMKELAAGRPRWGECTCPRVALDGTRVPGRGPCPRLLFPAPKGGPIDDSHFRTRVWNPAVEAARLCGRRPPERHRRGELRVVGVCGPDGCDDPAHRIPRYTPRVMRHTAASWLVQDGVPLYHVQALLGHEDPATTQRYAHLAPDAHERIVESWSRASGLTHI